jgi:hypothetical protein
MNFKNHPGTWWEVWCSLWQQRNAGWDLRQYQRCTSFVPVLITYRLYQPENSFGQLVCRVIFFLWRIFALWSQKKTHSVNYTGAFLGRKTYKSGHIMRTVLVDDRQVHIPDQK